MSVLAGMSSERCCSVRSASAGSSTPLSEVPSSEPNTGLWKSRGLLAKSRILIRSSKLRAELGFDIDAVLVHILILGLVGFPSVAFSSEPQKQPPECTSESGVVGILAPARDDRLATSEGGLLDIGNSWPSIDRLAGESGIFGGRGGKAAFALSIVGQKLGDGITSDGYLFLVPLSFGTGLEDAERLLR